MFRSLIIGTSVCLMLIITGKDAFCAEVIPVIISKNASELERLAARELSDQWSRLFGVTIEIRHQWSGQDKKVILLGQTERNPHLQKVLKEDWPELSDQGILIRSRSFNEQQFLILAGGSPVATLWAVYEWGYRHGIRYLFRGDVFPGGIQPLHLQGFNILMEPSLRVRTWRTVNDFPIGQESWGLQDLQRLFKQLAKRKFNRIMVSIYPWQPFVDYQFRGVRKQTAMLWFGDKYRVDGDTPGKTVFKGARYFENPDFAGKNTYESMTEAGIGLIRGIIDSGHNLGMSVGISIRPAEFPTEFKKVLPQAKMVQQLKQLTIGPGEQQGPEDPILHELVSTKLRAYLDHYPDIDSIYLGMPEFPEWEEHAEESWKQLQEKGQFSNLSLQDLIQAAENRNVIASGPRGIKAIRGNLAPLVFFQSLFSDPALLTRKDGRKVELVIRAVDPALYPVLDRVIPDGASTLNFLDYTAKRVADNQQLLSFIPTKRVTSRLILTLADDNVGILSQSAVVSLHSLMNHMKDHGWNGYSTRFWLLAELDPTIHYLSRASFDSSVTPHTASRDLFLALTDNEAAAERIWEAFQHIEAATNLIDQHAIGFGFPVSGMMMKHYQPVEDPAWWAEVTEHYTQAMIEFFRSNGASHPRSRNLIYYYAKRSEYVLSYLSAVQSLRQAAVAQQSNELDRAIEYVETAIESLYNGIGSLSEVAQDQCDRGLIAVLNKYAYRPLLQKYEKLLEESDAARANP